MKIAIGSDHAGFYAKESLQTRLESEGHEVRDVGCPSTDSVDYPDFARPVAEAVAAGEVERGVLICGTGTGVAMTANKTAGVRAVQAWSGEIARLAREHNDANVICFGARFQTVPEMTRILGIWLGEPFAGGRHGPRVEKIG
jgi:ribose 5-phosphate isomerase B